MDAYIPVWLAVVGLFSALLLSLVTAVIAPMVMARLQNKHALDLRKQDWARQDDVAEKLRIQQEHTAAILKQEQLAMATKLAAQQSLVNEKAGMLADLVASSAEKAENIAQTQGAQLRQIHTLVNATLSSAMERELTALKANLALMEKMFNLEPSIAATNVIEGVKIEIRELESQLVERIRKTSAAAEQFKQDTEGGRGISPKGVNDGPRTVEPA